MRHARTFTAAFLVLSIAGYSGAQTVRCTTWNLEWFPNGSAKEASTEQQNHRIKEAADVLRTINPDIVLLQESAELEETDRLLLSALRYWEVQHDLIEERIAAIRSVSVPS
jgi:endonuclease/exonuclease/phosphatase family metal-dependent hydrolase